MQKYKVQSSCVQSPDSLPCGVTYSFHLSDPQTHGCEILQLFQDVFSLLPIATIIDGKILIVHGGISDQTDLELLNTIERHKASWVAEVHTHILPITGQTVLSFSSIQLSNYDENKKK